MDDKERYQQKMKAQLDQWKAEIDRLKAKASGASADAQLKMNQHIEALEGKIDEGKAKLAALTEATGEAWRDMTSGVDTAWNALKSAFRDASDKFKNE